MGYNTLAFILNDFTDDLKRAPLTVTWMLTNPTGLETVDTVAMARHLGELPLNTQALRVLPPFHSSTMNFFVAGGNSIEQLKVARFGKSDGRKTITLFLPDWWFR